MTERGNRAAKASPVSESASVAVKLFEPMMMLIGVCAIRVIVLSAKTKVKKRFIFIFSHLHISTAKLLLLANIE